MVQDSVCPRRVALHPVFCVASRLPFECRSEFYHSFFQISRHVSDVLFYEELVIVPQNFVEVLRHRLHDGSAHAIDAVVEISKEEETVGRLIHG